MTKSENYKHVRINPITGEVDYYYPMEIPDLPEEDKPAFMESIRLRGLDVCTTRLGYRKFKAVMIPCKRIGYDDRGMEIYLDTPSEEQHRIYLEYIKDEMAEQEAQKEDGRCVIPDGRGGTKRCPCRMPNPDYTPGGDQPKTLAVKCEGCVYQEHKQAHTIIEMSALDQESDDGEPIPFEPAAPAACDSAWLYLKRRDEFLSYIAEREPKLVALATLLTLGYTQSEAARELGRAHSTVVSQTDKLKKHLIDFLKTVVSI